MNATVKLVYFKRTKPEHKIVKIFNTIYRHKYLIRKLKKLIRAMPNEWYIQVSVLNHDEKKYEFLARDVYIKLGKAWYECNKLEVYKSKY